MHATEVGCVDFRPPPAANSGECSVFALAVSEGVTTLTIANGRGNPDRLGSPPEYKLWVVGDPEQSVRYTIDVTWFRGPDC